MQRFSIILRSRRTWMLAAAGTALLAAGFGVWRGSQDRPHYVTALVTRGTIQKSVSTTGALNPVTTVQVGSYVSGTIKQLSCDFNTEVTIGQPCALVDPVPFQLIVDQDRAELGTAEAQSRKDQAALTYAKVAYERDSKLLDQGTVSQDTVDSEKSAYDQAVAQLGLDRASIVQKQAALKAAEVNLAYTVIVSPVVGTVITRSIDVGQTVAASLQTPTLFIIGKDLTKMQVDTNVSEADVGDIRPGEQAYFGVQAFPGRTFHGTVAQIRHGPITVQNVVTYDVVVAFDNPDRLLFPGMTADTHIVTEERRNVLRVPLTATRFSPEGFAGARREAGSSHAPSPAGETGPSPGRSAEAAPADRQGTSASGQSARPAAPPGDAGPGGERRREGRGSGAGRGEASGPHPHRRAGAPAHARVWVLAGGKLRPITVTTGIDDGAWIEVSGSDLHDGDTVVVNQISPKEDKRGPSPLNPVLRQAGPRL